MRVCVAAVAAVCLLAGCGVVEFVEEIAPDADSGRELAANLDDIESAFPEAHRVLSDGTWDSFDLEEKQAFVRELSIDAHKLSLDLRAERNADMVRDMRENGFDETSIEEIILYYELWELRTIEMDLGNHRQKTGVGGFGVVEVFGPSEEGSNP